MAHIIQRVIYNEDVVSYIIFSWDIFKTCRLKMFNDSLNKSLK